MKKLYLLAAAALCAATATAANGDVTDGWLMLEDFEGTAPEMTAFDKSNGNAISTGTIEVATMDKDGNASNHALQFTPAGGYSHGIQIKATLPEGKTIADYTDIRFDICGVNTDNKPLHLFINGTKITEDGSNVVGSKGKWYTRSYSISVSGSGNEITVGFYNHTSNSATIAFDNICLKEKSGGTGEDPDPTPGDYDESTNGTVTDGWLMIQDYQTKKPGDEIAVGSYYGGSGQGSAKIEVDPAKSSNLVATATITDGNFNTVFAFDVVLPTNKVLKDYEEIAFDLYRFSDDGNYKQLIIKAGEEQIYLDLKDNGDPNYVEQAKTETWTEKKYSIDKTSAVGNTFRMYLGIKTNEGHYAIDNIRLKERIASEDPDPIQPGESLNGTVTDGWLMGEDFEVATEAPALFDYYGNTPGGTATIETQAKDNNSANKVAKFTGGNWNSGLSVSIKLPEGKTLADYDALDFDMYNYDMENKSIFVYIDKQAIREPAGDNDQGKKNSWKHFFYEIETTGNTATEIAVNIGFKINSNSFAIDNIRLREREPELEVVGEPVITIKHGTAAGTMTVSYSFEVKNHNGEEIKVVATVDGHDEVIFEEAAAEPENAPARAADENKTFSGNLKAQHDVLKTISNPNVSLTATAGEKQLFAITKAPDTTTGIEDVTIDSEAPVEYFNLQGLRVAQPEAGQLYIKRQGDKAVKVRF